MRALDYLIVMNVDIARGKIRLARFRTASYRRTNGHLLGESSLSMQPSGLWPAASIEAGAGQANHLFNFDKRNIASYANMMFINAKFNNDWIEGGAGANTNLKLIKAGGGGDQAYASSTQTQYYAVAAQKMAGAIGRSDLLLNGVLGSNSIFEAVWKYYWIPSNSFANATVFSQEAAA